MEGLKQGGKGGGEGIGGASGTMGREKEGNSADGDKRVREVVRLKYLLFEFTG